MRHRVVSLLAALLLAQAASAVTQGQEDQFSASANGWQRGVPALGGPGGGSDGFLLLTADGGSMNGRLVTFNGTQWAGDYLGAGVEAIGVFLNNLGSTPLQIRLALGDQFSPNLGGSWYSTTASAALPANSGWVFALFEIGSNDVQSIQGTATYTQVMQNVDTLRILHASAPDIRGDFVVGTLGIDGVIALPEPGAAAQLACGIAALAACGGLRARSARSRAGARA